MAAPVRVYRQVTSPPRHCCNIRLLFYSRYCLRFVHQLLNNGTCLFGISEYRFVLTTCAHLVSSFEKVYSYILLLVLYPGIILRVSTWSKLFHNWSGKVVVDNVDDWTTTEVASSILFLLVPPNIDKTSLPTPPKTTLGIHHLDFGSIVSFVGRSRLVLIGVDDSLCFLGLSRSFDSTTGCNNRIQTFSPSFALPFLTTTQLVK